MVLFNEKYNFYNYIKQLLIHGDSLLQPTFPQRIYNKNHIHSIHKYFISFSVGMIKKHQIIVQTITINLNDK